MRMLNAAHLKIITLRKVFSSIFSPLKSREKKGERKRLGERGRKKRKRAKGRVEEEKTEG